MRVILEPMRSPFARQMLTAQAKLQGGASLLQVTLAVGLTSIHQFSWRYYCYFGHWPTHDVSAAPPSPSTSALSAPSPDCAAR